MFYIKNHLFIHVTHSVSIYPTFLCLIFLLYIIRCNEESNNLEYSFLRSFSPSSNFFHQVSCLWSISLVKYEFFILWCILLIMLPETISSTSRKCREQNSFLHILMTFSFLWFDLGRPKTFAVNNHVIFCTNHYKQLFATKGNYDEGFGRDQHKKRWKSESNLSEGHPKSPQ